MFLFNLKCRCQISNPDTGPGSVLPLDPNLYNVKQESIQSLPLPLLTSLLLVYLVLDHQFLLILVASIFLCLSLHTKVEKRSTQT
jgi:hypothetical protein